MSYRVELAKTGRAGCAATHCKNEGTKIEKGELRQGTLVTIQENTSFKWRHWGCVTPTVLHNWKASCGMDEELVDGLDILPEPEQKRVMKALELEHVDDKDWNGDVEVNRFNPANPNQGMFAKTPKPKKSKKKSKDADEEDDDLDDVEEDSPVKKKAASKKRRAAEIDVAEEDLDKAKPKKAAKQTKAAGKAMKVAQAGGGDDVHEDDGPVTSAKKPRKKARPAVSPEMAEPEADTVPAKKARGKKAAMKATVPDDENEAPKPKPKRKGRAKKNAAADDDD